MTLRIIGGRFRHRTLISPKGSLIRPSTGQLREALFNICQNTIQGCHFLDLFAGSGAIGLEALSRGAKQVTFVEQDRLAIKAIRDNLELLECAAEATVLSGDVFPILRHLIAQRKQFDILFADPPYAQMIHGIPLSHHLLNMVDESGVLHEGGSLFIEEAAEAVPPPNPLKRLTFKNQRRYGRSVLQEWMIPT